MNDKILWLYAKGMTTRETVEALMNGTGLKYHLR